MAIIKQYLKNLQTNAGTGGIIYDLTDTQGIDVNLSTGNLNNANYTEMLAWQLTVDSYIASSSFPISINVISMSGTVGLRWRLQKVNSSNTVLTSSAYSSIFSTVAVHTETATFSETWATGDRLRLSFEIARTGGMGNVSLEVSVNNKESFVDVDLDLPVSVRRVFFTT